MFVRNGYIPQRNRSLTPSYNRRPIKPADMGTILFLFVLHSISSFRQSFCQVNHEHQDPYTVRRILRTGNLVALSCRSILRKDIQGAVFFRNGVHQENDSCFQPPYLSNETERLELNVTPSCEGSFMCGRKEATGKFILSGPTVIFGKIEIAGI